MSQHSVRSARNQSAFTLIELLVVIAIIAILAAILFPVFAQAREKARTISCLSNTKQLGLAMFMYTQDYDERFPTSWAKGFPGDPMFFVQPYLKNLGVLHCPSFTISTSAANAVCGAAANDPYGSWNLQPGGSDNPTGELNMWGYGFNLGPEWFSTYASGSSSDMDGLMDDPRTPDLATGSDGSTPVQMSILGQTVPVVIRPYARPGKTLASIAAPANCLMMADTTEPPLSGIELQALRPTASGDSPCQKLLNANNPRHTGGYNFVYVDGHAKYSKWSGQATAWGDPGSVSNLCSYFHVYDGGNNPGNCQTGGL
jgi:prepilin-type N-terminal cleavage/methylation domain-containing protein/prepilin-type processing-associated H-X9-DG protein